ncbi:MAG: hypothetical protein NTW03_05270, partial [Verrucomicrobia bacterium]|nr:hypothetical protein [Verrucomicrobiota bacterium]
MKTNLGRLIWVIIPMVVCLPTAAHAALFSNFATDLNTRLNPGIDEIGDEVILAGGPPGANYNIT